MTNHDKYESLRKALNKEKSWPLVYMFKFIIPANNKNIALIEAKFSDEAIITRKESAKGKYFSYTVKEVMLDAESVIDIYKEMEKIEGLIAL